MRLSLKLGLMICLLFIQSCTNRTLLPDQHGSQSTAQADFQKGNYYEAFDDLLYYAEHGNKDAQYAVGYMYYYGLGTAKDQNTARYWIRKASEQGQPAAKRAMYEITRDSQQYSAAQAGVKNDTIIPTPPPKPVPQTTQPISSPISLNDDQEWIHHQTPQNYTIKLASLKDTPNPKQRIEKTLGLKNTKQYQFKKDGITWEAVITGSYRRHIDAEQDLQTLPTELRNSAQIVLFSQVQKRMS